VRSYLLSFFQLLVFTSFAQTIEVPSFLHVDSSQAFIQAYCPDVLQRLQAHFDRVSSEKLVFVHYGGSHIQAEKPTTVTRRLMHEKFGYGGRGILFSYGAASTYNSVNYTTTQTGKWKYNKSYQGRKADLPLGLCGMVVETADSNASIDFNFKNGIDEGNYRCFLFFENDDQSYGLRLFINEREVPLAVNAQYSPHGVSFPYAGSPIRRIRFEVTGKPNGKRFRFYGLNVETEANGGVVYHSTGVGAAPYRSVLILDKLPEQMAEINPDIVLLDFGTNDILFTNSIDPKLPSQVERAVQVFKQINPEILVVLTSTQDMYYKGKNIPAAITFRNLMDSLARKNDCLFWNWYDISGGLKTIKEWNANGYASNDCIHLTTKGYEVKGKLLFDSFVNTLDSLRQNPSLQSLTIPMKDYSKPILHAPSDSTSNLHKDTTEQVIQPQVPIRRTTIYTVKKGDTLSAIASKHHVGVVQLKRANGLRSDSIQIGQKLKIPK